MRSFPLEKRLEWHTWVTPRLLREKPIHRWYSFPHSFTSELVECLIKEWQLRPSDRIIDPFVGAGTTLLTAKQRGIPATGYDLSPLAVLVSNTKISNFSKVSLDGSWKILKTKLNSGNHHAISKNYPELIKKALPGQLLVMFDQIAVKIQNLKSSEYEKEFFRLAMLKTLRIYSRAVATGGWLKWVNNRERASTVRQRYGNCVEFMLEDIVDGNFLDSSHWKAGRADARALPEKDSSCSAIVTSPPYPNRHDYTRVFGVELMFAFMTWEEARQLRYQSFHSHPEARPQRPNYSHYNPPKSLVRTIEKITRKGNDERVPKILDGYFTDMYLSLQECSRVCKNGGKIAYVVGNAQYSGEPVLVDEITAEIGKQVGLNCQKLIVMRCRGNSAQQMRVYGIRPARESIVIFEKL